MLDFILFTVFIFIMALLQKMESIKTFAYNNNTVSELNKKKDKGTFMVIAMVVMMFLAMFRGVNVGSDTQAYHDIFYNIIYNPDYSHASRYEIGYILLNKFVGLFTKDAQGIIIVTSFFYYTVFIWFIKKYSKDYSFVLLLFYLMVFSETINIIRQQIATAFILIAIDRIINAKTFRSLIWIAVACLFHTSAVLFFVLPFTQYFRYYNSVATIGLLIVAVLTFGKLLPKIVGVIAPQYEHYFYGSNAGTGEVTVFYETMRGIVFLGLAAYVLNLNRLDKFMIVDGKLGYNQQRNFVLWVLFIILAVTIMSFSLYVFRRFAIYLGIISIVLLSNYINKINPKLSTLMKISIILVLLAYYAVLQYTRPTWNSAFPYEFFI